MRTLLRAADSAAGMVADLIFFTSILHKVEMLVKKKVSSALPAAPCAATSETAYLLAVPGGTRWACKSGVSPDGSLIRLRQYGTVFLISHKFLHNVQKFV